MIAFISLPIFLKREENDLNVLSALDLKRLITASMRLIAISIQSIDFASESVELEVFDVS